MPTHTKAGLRTQLYAALDQTGRVIAGVSPAQLGGPTPCTEFDVRDLSKHLVGVARRLAAIGRREPQSGEVDVDGLSDDNLAEAFEEARREALALWSDDAILGEELVLPWASMPGAVVASIYMLEMTMHSWDLAVSTGQLDALDPALAEASLGVATQMLPEEPRDADFPFTAVVPVPEDAPAYDRLAGYLGRQPALV